MDVGIAPGQSDRTTTIVLGAINKALGSGNLTRPRGPWSMDALLQVARTLIAKRYDPDRWFTPGGAIDDFITAAPEPLVPGRRYVLPLLNGTEPSTAPLSRREGGVLYETPFWFLLAAFAIGRSGRLAIIPHGPSLPAIHAGQNNVLQALRDGHFTPERWLAEATPTVPSGADLTGTVTIPGEALDRMMDFGADTWAGPEGIAHYVVYRYDGPGVR